MTSVRQASPAAAGTFLATAALIVAYALDDGSYSLLARQQAGLLIWTAIAAAAAFGLLPAARPRRALLVALGALAGLALWSAASLSWSESDDRTLAEVARAIHHLGLLMLVVIVAGRERWLAVVAGASAGATLVSAYSLGVRLAPGLFGADVTANAFGTNRLSSPLGYWNAVGAWSAMTAALLVAWSAHARTAVVRVLALASVPAVLLALYLSYSRAGVGDLVLGLIVVVAFAPLRLRTAVNAVLALALGAVVVLVVRGAPQIAELTGVAGRGRVIATLIVCGAVAGACALLPLPRRAVRTAARGRGSHSLAGVAALALAVLAVAVVPHAWHQFAHASATPAGTDPAARLTTLQGTRYSIYASAVESFRARPLEGSGAGTFEFTWNRDARTGEFVRDAHSLELEALSELGIPGALLVLALLGGGLTVLATARAAVGRSEGGPDVVAGGAVAGCAGACAAWALAASLDWMWEVTAVTALFLVLLGAAGAAGLRPAPAPRPLQRRIALVIAALACATLMVPGLREDSALRASRASITRGNLPAAARDALRAQHSAPWAAAPRLQLALVDEQVGALGAARSELLAARRREPTNWRIPYILSRVEVARGDLPAALAAYRVARSLRPLGSVFAASAATP